MFGSNIASSKSTREEASTNIKANPADSRQVAHKNLKPKANPNPKANPKQIQQREGKWDTNINSNQIQLEKIQSKSSRGESSDAQRCMLALANHKLPNDIHISINNLHKKINFLCLLKFTSSQGGLLVAVAADSSSLGARIAGSVSLYYM